MVLYVLWIIGNETTPSRSTGGGRIVCFFGTNPAHVAVLVACISHYTNLPLNNHGVVRGVNAPHKQEQPGEQERVHKHRGGVHLRAYYFHLHATCTAFIGAYVEHAIPSASLQSLVESLV